MCSDNYNEVTVLTRCIIHFQSLSFALTLASVLLVITASAPHDVKATPYNTTAITLTWQPPKDISSGQAVVSCHDY